MTFQLDTTGTVQCPAPDQKPNESTGCWFWSDLDAFTQGYVEAMLHPTEVLHYSLTDRFAGFSDLAPETLTRIIADCAAVTKRVADRLLPVMFGGTFWMQRAAGFPHVGAEDRGWCVAHFPRLTVQLSDDGKVRFA